MVIASMIRMRIGTKLQLNNIVLILTLLVVTSVSFHLLSGRYVIKETQQLMRAEAESIIKMLRGMQDLSSHSIAERVAGRNQLRIAGRFIESKMVIFDGANRLVYTNVARDEIKTLTQIELSDHPDYLIVRRSILSKEGDRIGRIVVATKIRDVHGMNQLLRRALTASIIIGGLFALVMSYLLGQHISKPLRTLTTAMRRFSLKEQLPSPIIRTRDEIKELADSFSEMANKLRESDRTQISFLQNASHELKTPLMSIQGNAEAIKEGIVQGQEAADSLDVIAVECQRLKLLVDEMIYLTRLDNVNEAFRFEQIAVGHVISEAIMSVQGLAEQKGIMIEIAGDMDHVGRFDREKLKRAFINIIGNGVRYAHSKIVLNVAHLGEWLEIVCTDDGKGFAVGEEQRIFDRFYKGEYGGTGIGLAITKAIVEAHGGSIEAFQGKSSIGAVIRIRLPLNLFDSQ
jgi:signal transduction histidine kinase